MLKHHTPTLAPGPNASNIVTTMKDFQSTSRYPLVIVKGHGYTFEDVVGNILHPIWSMSTWMFPSKYNRSGGKSLKNLNPLITGSNMTKHCSFCVESLF
jgi:hypothetical protein